MVLCPPWMDGRGITSSKRPVSLQQHRATQIGNRDRESKSNMPSVSKSKSKKGQSTTSSLEKYQGMTLDELSKLDDGNDEEIDEEEAFNSEDEENYGKYFSSTKTIFSDVGPRNIALSIPIIALTPTKDPNQHICSVEIASGSILTISSVCLDVLDCAFHRARLMYRCVYDDNDDNDDEKDGQFLALCNFLDTKRGGMGLMPSNVVNLKVVGPCKVDFRAGALPCVNLDDKINVFGVIEPSKYLYDYDEDDDDDDYFPYADAFMSGTSEGEDDEDDEDEEEGMEDEEEEDVVVEGQIKDSEKMQPKGATEGSSSSRKRKQDENVKDVVMDSTTNIAAESQSNTGDNSKLTKAQRKKLAQEKAKQLEETLAAARNDEDETKNSDNNNEPQTKKSKKQLKKEKAMEQNSTSTQTRERRLAGGLIVSDVVLGAGAPVKPGKRISLHYTGTLRSTGKAFDKNHSKQHPLVFRQGTGEVIRGLERGLEGMRAGGERVITIPSNLGYGSKGAGDDIPPDSDLVFEVKVLKVG